MFRGIIEGTGRVVARTRSAVGERLVVDLAAIAVELEIGQSVAINGTCLTVVERQAAGAAFDLAGETLRRTNLGRLEVGSVVNYERAMRLSDRLDGHLVQGHVDGVGTLVSFEHRHDDRWLELAAPPDLLATMVAKGCIAVDGISLTIAELGADRIACTIVPHTFEVTNLKAKRVGDAVNLECDVLLKWIERLQAKSLGG